MPEQTPLIPGFQFGGGVHGGLVFKDKDEALDAILSAEDFHDATLDATWLGASFEEVRDAFDRSIAADPSHERHSVWKSRGADKEIRRLIAGATKKRLKAAQDAFAGVVTPVERMPTLPVGPPPSLPLMGPSDFASRPFRDRQWIVDPIIPKGETTLIYGPGSAGKSLLLLQLAFASACGRSWLTREVPPGRVLFFTCEDDADEINRRAAKILTRMKLSWSDCGDRLAIIPMRGTDASAVLAVAERDGRLSTTPTYEALRQVVATFGPDIVIIDTLADVFAGNENDRGHAKQFIKLCERLGPCTYIVTAHPSVSGQADGRGASGSTGWPAAVRSHLYLSRVKDEGGREPDPDVRRLSNLKANYARAGDGEIELVWREGVFERTDIEARDAFSGREADDVFLELLAIYNKRRVNVSTSPGSTYAPSRFAKEEIAKKARVLKKALTEAMGRLLDAGKIVNVQHRGGADARYHLEVVSDD